MATSGTYGIPASAMRVMGAVMVVGGILSAAASTYFNLYKDFVYRANVQALESVGPGSLMLGTSKVFSSLVIAAVGIFVLRNAHDRKRLLLVNDRLGVALVLYLVGLLAMTINTAINRTCLALMINGVYACYPLLVIPCTCGFFAVAKDYLQSGKRKVLMWVLYALTIVLSLLSSVLGTTMMFAYMMR